MPAHVLIVEDENPLARMYEQLLTHAGYYVMTASNAQQAIKSLMRFNPDVVYLDWNLEGGTCEPFLTHLQTLPAASRPAVLVISAEVTMDKITPYKDVIQGVFIKPILIKDLLQIIQASGQAKTERKKLHAIGIKALAPGVIHYIWKGVITADAIREAMKPELREAIIVVFDIRETTLELLDMEMFAMLKHPPLGHIRRIHIVHEPDFHLHASYLMAFLRGLLAEVKYHTDIKEAIQAATMN